MIPQEDVATRILALAGESSTKTISGGRLSELLKHQFPNFSPASSGAKNLRAFIRENLAGRLIEVGKVGADIVYGLPGAIPAQTQAQLPSQHSASPITQEVSRVFRSPNAPFELHANRGSGMIKVVEMGAPILDGWVRIKPASPDIHRKVARDFVSELPDDDRDYLMRILNEYPNTWWPKFSIYVQEKNLYKQWLAFKGNQLRSLLLGELNNLGVAQAEVNDRPLVMERSDRKDVSRPADALGDTPQSSRDLRDVILRVVQSLPTTELRALKLPVGDVYDALRHRN